jgi:hypothetical protein
VQEDFLPTAIGRDEAEALVIFPACDSSLMTHAYSVKALAWGEWCQATRQIEMLSISSFPNFC